VSARDRTVIAVVAVVVALGAAWLLVISPKRSELSKLKSQVSAQQAQLAQEQSAVQAGELARSQFAASYASLVKLGEAVPTDDNVPSLIYQIQAAANSTGVDFRALSVGSNSSGGSAPAGSQTPLPPGVTVGPSGFPMEPFSFTFRGSFFRLADFFSRLQRFVTATSHGIAVRGRLLTLDSVTLSPQSSGFPQIEATVSATAYLLPAAQGLAAGASPAGPAPAAAASSAAPAGSSATSASSASSSPAAPPAAAITGGQP